jgi:hypothetical protein
VMLQSHISSILVLQCISLEIEFTKTKVSVAIVK